MKKFEGKPVVAVGVEIRNAAGGLQEALKFDPVEWPQGAEQFIVLRCLVKAIDHEPVDKDDYAGPQRRVHVLHAAEAFPIDAEVVEAELASQRERVKKARIAAEEEALGTPGMIDPDNKVRDIGEARGKDSRDE